VVVLQYLIIEAAGILSSNSGAAKLLPPKLCSASQRQAAIALNRVCEHLGFHFVHPLARCVLRYQKSLREVTFWVCECSKILSYKLMITASYVTPFWLMKVFIGMLSFWIAGKPAPTSPSKLAKMKERYFQLFQFWIMSRWFPRLYFLSTYLLFSYVLIAFLESKPCLREVCVCVCVCARVCLCWEKEHTHKERIFIKPIVMDTICFFTSLWLIIINNFKNFLLDFGKLFPLR